MARQTYKDPEMRPTAEELKNFNFGNSAELGHQEGKTPGKDRYLVKMGAWLRQKKAGD